MKDRVLVGSFNEPDALMGCALGKKRDLECEFENRTAYANLRTEPHILYFCNILVYISNIYMYIYFLPKIMGIVEDLFLNAMN
jgi:hypothetical protein